MKCNSSHQVLSLLADLGTGFDCASISEINKILELGVDPSRIIYANPAKHPGHLREAYMRGVTQTVFDNEDELYKIKEWAPHAEVFLRIMVDDTSSLCRLSQKYGAPLDTTAELLDLAKQLDINLVGVSFHCGSGVSDPSAFTKAVEDARVVFDQAEATGLSLKVLDVGGGFTAEGFESMANTLNQALEDNFPPSVRVIGEPGRYYVSSAFTVACQIIARRVEKDPVTHEKRYKIYINDGVYGNFASLIYDHQHVQPRILSKSGGDIDPTIYSVWGQTCDGLDKINDKVALPGVLNIGDWVYFNDMGAYTICCATEFNGFSNKHTIIYVSSEQGASALLGFNESDESVNDGMDPDMYSDESSPFALSSTFVDEPMPSGDRRVSNDSNIGDAGRVNRQLHFTAPAS